MSYLCVLDIINHSNISYSPPQLRIKDARCHSVQINVTVKNLRIQCIKLIPYNIIIVHPDTDRSNHVILLFTIIQVHNNIWSSPTVTIIIVQHTVCTQSRYTFTESTLKIKETRLEDTGVYSCNARLNVVGSVITASKSTILTVVGHEGK
jgi:hypothetical protein